MAMYGFLAAIGIIALLWLFLFLLCRGAPSAFYAKEGMVCVGVSWIVLSLTGCLPFWFSREIPSFVDAFFETVSGFTTTGSSILSDVEALSMGLLYWRSFSHWLAEWACWFSCWLSSPEEQRVPDSPCICSGLRALAPM